MIQTVRPFQRTIEPSFPDNDALPKKNEDDQKFDKRFNEWYDDMKINLDRLQDQLTTFFQTDLNDSLETQRQTSGDALSSVNKTLVTSLQDLTSSLLKVEEDLTNSLQEVKDNLYSE